MIMKELNISVVSEFCSNSSGTSTEPGTATVPRTSTESGTSLSVEAAFVIQWVLFAVVCQAVDILGIIANIINIICFVKQGFKDPVNISLLGTEDF